MQAAKAGLMEIADVFVINKADRAGAAQTRRDLEQMLEHSDSAEAAWRPPVIDTVATAASGVGDLWDAVLAHRDHITRDGVLVARRRQRLDAELTDIVARRLEQRARAMSTGERWGELRAGVLDQHLDPWTAADEMLRPVDA